MLKALQEIQRFQAALPEISSPPTLQRALTSESQQCPYYSFLSVMTPCWALLLSSHFKQTPDFGGTWRSNAYSARAKKQPNYGWHRDENKKCHQKPSPDKWKRREMAVGKGAFCHARKHSKWCGSGLSRTVLSSHGISAPENSDWNGPFSGAKKELEQLLFSSMSQNYFLLPWGCFLVVLQRQVWNRKPNVSWLGTAGLCSVSVLVKALQFLSLPFFIKCGSWLGNTASMLPEMTFWRSYQRSSERRWPFQIQPEYSWVLGNRSCAHKRS